MFETYNSTLQIPKQLSAFDNIEKTYMSHKIEIVYTFATGFQQLDKIWLKSVMEKVNKHSLFMIL